MMPCGTREEAYEVIYNSLAGNESETAKAMRSGLAHCWRGLEKMGASILASICKWWVDAEEGALFYWYKYRGEIHLTRYYVAKKSLILEETFQSEAEARKAFITEAHIALEDGTDPYWGWSSEVWRKGA